MPKCSQTEAPADNVLRVCIQALYSLICRFRIHFRNTCIIWAQQDSFCMADVVHVSLGEGWIGFGSTALDDRRWKGRLRRPGKRRGRWTRPAQCD